jgi:hypothetical protein
MSAFGENLTIQVNPSKTGGDWWYGKVVRDGKTGFFPKTYVQKVEAGMAHFLSCLNHILNHLAVKATALYSYTGENADELPFTEGDILSIIDRDEADWWKAEKEGVVFIVPAAYLEVNEG